MELFEKLKEKFYQDDIREAKENSKFLFEKNKKGPILLGDFTITNSYLIGGLIACAIGALGYFVWDWWNKHKDSDGDGLPDWIEVNKLHTNPFDKDTDKDGLDDKFEVDNGLDPLKPNPVYTYLKKKNSLEVYKLFKPLENDSKLDNDEKALIEYYLSLGDYKNNEFVLSLLKMIVKDGRVTPDELNKFMDWDEDKLENLKEVKEYGTDPFKPNPNVSYVLNKGFPLGYLDLVKPLDNDEEMDLNERKFNDLLVVSKDLLVVNTLLNYLKNVSNDGIVSSDELIRASNFSSLVKELFHVVSKEKSVKDAVKDIDYAAQLGLKLNFDEIKASDATAFALGEYAVSVNDLNLPLEFDALMILTRCTQVPKYGNKLVDFSPIVFHSVDGKDYVLEINVPRDVWMLARHLYLIKKEGFDVERHPEMFEGIKSKIVANAWSLFDAEYGLRFAERRKGRIISPVDKDVWDLIMLQWRLYSSFAPQFGGGDRLYNRDFPWYNSDLLENLYPDVNTRRQALLFFFHLPNATFDMKKQKVVRGIEGAKTSLLQAYEEYKKISSLYPDGKVRTHYSRDLVTPRFYYEDWLGDRANNGLFNTVNQFFGDATRLFKSMSFEEVDQMIRYNSKGIDGFLTQNWRYWDLVKFIVGYERWNPNAGPELTAEAYILCPTLRMFGFPTKSIYIYPEPKGTPHWEWAISLPTYLVNKMRNRFKNDLILIGPGNIFGLYSCGDGLIKDGVKEVKSFHIYLMRKA